MATYLIKLFPVERFFFGSDITFGTDNENYFIRSVYFPQQTTLLGMLRLYLLRQKPGLLDEDGGIKNKNTANDLIGAVGFQASPDDDYGIINKLSPVFIVGPDGEYFVQSREYGLQLKEDEVTGEKLEELVPLQLKSRKGKCTYSDQEISYFKGMTAKTVIPELLVNARTGQMRYLNYDQARAKNPMNGIFVPNQQVGIRLPKEGRRMNDDNEKAFYKQIGYTMVKGYGFAFYADFKEGSSLNFKEGFVKLGADQSVFRLEALGQTDLLYKDFPAISGNLYQQGANKDEKVVLLSDAYLPKEKFDRLKIRFASTSTVPFRYMMTKSNSEGSSGEESSLEAESFLLKRAGIKIHKTNNYMSLLKKGSVFFLANPVDKENLIQEIKSETAFYKIGYNHAN